MPALFQNAPVAQEERAANDQHTNVWVVALVLGALGVYVYLLTDVSRWLGLPSPRQWMEPLELFRRLSFRDGSGAVDASLDISFRTLLPSTEGLLVLMGFTGLAFVGGYYAPLAYKKACHVACTVVALVWLYGPFFIGGLISAHVLLYVTLHPFPKRAPMAGLALGTLVGCTFFSGWPLTQRLALALAAGLLGGVLYRFAWLPLLQTRAAPYVRTIAVQSPLIVVLTGAILQGLGAPEWKLPMGLLLFFWQWERLILYHVDYKAGTVPENVPLVDYLAVFLTPAAVPKWQWGVTIGQGYAYLDSGFYAQDKNKLALSGVKYWGIALLYILLFDVGRAYIAAFFEWNGIPVYRVSTSRLVEHYLKGGAVTMPSVLVTTTFDILRWMAIWAGVVHWKVGTWRVLGYRMDPYFDKPFLATNLVDFWTRFTFHYREFLSRAFYYPVFFKLPRFLRRNLKVRVVLATLAAATVGNLIWGHVTERLFYRDVTWAEAMEMLSSWPYYVMLGVGITVTEVYLMTRGPRKRKHWRWDRYFPLDVLAAYATVQFFGLIHIFNRPMSVDEFPRLVRLFLVGFGFPG